MSGRSLVRMFWLPMSVGIFLVMGVQSPCQTGEDPRTSDRFLQELRDKGYHDLALEFIDQLRKDPSLPADKKVLLDYQEGRTQIDEAARSSDLTRKRELLEEARSRLEAFVKAHPDHPQAREALVQVARMLVERGHLALLTADDLKDKSEQAIRKEEARASFTQARDAFGKAVDQYSASLKSYSGYIPRGDPRIEERDKISSAMLDATLQRAVTDYEIAQTFPADSKDRTAKLAEALTKFEDLYKRHRTQMAGLAAQMWQAKCYEEQGKIGEAIGIYKILLEQPAPELRALQRFVQYFHIVALAKRKDHALAADEALNWLKKYNKREERRSKEGLGVLLELAKNIDAQINEETTAAERQQATRQITDAVREVVRYASPFKNEALALLKKYKPGAVVKAQDIARMTFDVAVADADEAIASRDWDRAILLLRAALTKVDPRREPDKANQARYNLAFCYYMDQKYYESYVLAEHLARRYPQAGLAPKASEIGMQSLAEAYNSVPNFDRAADLERLIELAKYTAETYKEREQGDEARMNLGLIYQGRGQYDEAIESLALVREKSPKRIEAQTRMGGAHWAKSRMLERKGEKENAAGEAKAAIDLMQKTLKDRQAANTPPTDPLYVGNAADLAVALTETGKPAEALTLIDPVVKAQTVKSGVPFSRLMEAMLLAQIQSGQVDQAIASMKSLEQSGGSASSRAQLYFKLGRLLERELDRLRKVGNKPALTAMEQSYRSFLNALVESKSGLTYESLQWAGESLLSLGAGAEAEKVLRRVLDESVKNPEFLSQKGSSERILRTRLKLAAALRTQGKDEPRKFDESEAQIEQLLEEYKKYIEPRVEKGMLLEARAEAGKGDWGQAFKHWQDLAQQLGRMSKRPITYYDAWYHAAWALVQQRQNAKARQALSVVMRLNPEVGGPEMKAKYQEFLSRIK